MDQFEFGVKARTAKAQHSGIGCPRLPAKYDPELVRQCSRKKVLL